MNLLPIYRAFALLALLSAVSPITVAARPSARCYVDDLGTFLPEPKTFELGFSTDGKMPEVTFGKNERIGVVGKPIGIRWISLTDEMAAEVSKVSNFHGRAIYQFNYRVKHNNPKAIEVPFCIMLAYQTGTISDHSKTLLRPFLILTGDEQVESVNTGVESNERHPFSVVSRHNFKGNGVAWVSCLFIFDRDKAHLAERAEGGRHRHTKTYFYNKRGKIISVEIDPDH